MKWQTFVSLAVPLVLLLLVGCAGPQAVVNSRPQPVTEPPSRLTTPTTSIVATAQTLLGTPYRYGGSAPSGFDCSGLVYYAYAQAGIRIPRTSQEQFRAARKIQPQSMQPGDVLFFRLSPPKVSHVGIYAGAGRFIHAPSSGKSVQYASLDNSYWRNHLVAAGRFE